MSQSALSATIRALERELDTRLFVRTTRTVVLTDAGAALAVEARRTLDAAAAAVAAVQATHDVVQGTLNLGGVRTTGRYDQVGLVVTYRERHPNVLVRVRVDSSMTLIEEVVQGRIDIAFVSLRPSMPRQLTVRELFADPLGVVLPPDDPLARRRRLALADLGDRALIGGPPGSVLQTATERALHPGDRPTVTVNDVSALLDFVEHGLGVAICAEVDAAERPPLRWVPLTDDGLVWRVGVITGPPALLPRAATAFLDLIP